MINDMPSSTYLSHSSDLYDLTVVVLSYNRREELSKNLPKLCKSSTINGFELIVVDNASDDGSREFLHDLAIEFSCLKLIFNDSNLGVADGRNAGWRATTRDFILNIDDDTWVEEQDLFKLLDVAKSNIRVGVISPRIIHAISNESQCDHGAERCQISNFHGACHIVKKQAYLEVGEIDSGCSFGGEELDYSIRMRNLGFDVIYYPDVTVKHNSFVRKGANGAWRRRQWIYNFTRVFFKHFSFLRASMLSVRFMASHMFSGLRSEGVLFSLSLIIPFVRGIVHGRLQHHPVSLDVMCFYNNSQLRPEFGNVPLWKKLCHQKLGINIRK
jgi:GT2 family glycosyltransferase